MADFDLSSILSSLTPEDMDNIKQLASDFLGGNNADNNEPSENKSKDITPQLPDISALGLGGLPDLSVISSIVPVLQAVNRPDERVQFINAMKPLLSDSRKQKADEAINLLRLISVIPLLRERGIM